MNGDSGVTEMAKRMAARSTVATGQVILGTTQIKKLQALVYWVKDHEKRGLDIEPTMWMAAEMNTAMERNGSEFN